MLDRQMSKEIFKVKDLARYLHCHQSTIYRLVKGGQIPGFRLGGGWRFRIDEIDRWCRRIPSTQISHSHRSRKS
jgi:excisionase family DNA binding protein